MTADLSNAAAPAFASTRPDVWRVLAYAALPLVLAGMLPLYAALALCGVFALCAWQPELGRFRVGLGALVVGGAAMYAINAAEAAGDQRFLVASLVVVTLQVLGLALTSFVADTAAELRSRTGLLLLLPALFAPHPLALLAFVGAALLRHSPDDRSFRSRWAGRGSETGRLRLLLWPLLLALAVVLLAALLLPRASLWAEVVDYMGTPEYITGTVTQERYQYEGPDLLNLNAAQEEAQRRIGEGEQDGDPAARVLNTGNAAPVLAELLTVGMAALLLLGTGVLVWKHVRGGRLLPKSSLLQLAGLLGIVLMMLVLARTSLYDTVQADIAVEENVTVVQGQDTGLQEGFVGLLTTLGRSILGDINTYNLIFLFVGGLAALLLLYMAWLMWRMGLPPAEGADEEAGAAPQTALEYKPLGVETAPLHRVRHAYARVEAHLEGHGLPRRRNETPAEYFARVSTSWPDIEGALRALAAAYAPVRYGGGVSAEQAAKAEAGARGILAARPPSGAGSVYSSNINE